MEVGLVGTVASGIVEASEERVIDNRDEGIAVIIGSVSGQIEVVLRVWDDAFEAGRAGGRSSWGRAVGYFAMGRAGGGTRRNAGWF